MTYIRLFILSIFLVWNSFSMFSQEYLNTNHFYSIDGHLVQLSVDSVLQFVLYSDNDTIFYTTGNFKCINESILTAGYISNHFNKTQLFKQFDQSNPIVKYLMLGPNLSTDKQESLTKFTISTKYLIPYFFKNTGSFSTMSIVDSVQFVFVTNDMSIKISFYSNNIFKFTLKTPIAIYTVLGDYYIVSNIVVISSQDKNKNLLKLLTYDGKLEIFANLLIGTSSLKGIGTSKSQFIYILKSN